MIFTCSNARSGSPGAVEGAEVAQWWGKETWSRKGPFPAISGCLLASQLWRLGPTHASLFLGTHKGWGRNGFSFLLNWLKFLTKDTHSSRFLLAWWPATGRRGLAASWARAWDELGAGGTDRQKGAQERAGECLTPLQHSKCSSQRHLPSHHRTRYTGNYQPKVTHTAPLRWHEAPALPAWYPEHRPLTAHSILHRLLDFFLLSFPFIAFPPPFLYMLSPVPMTEAGAAPAASACIGATLLP